LHSFAILTWVQTHFAFALKFDLILAQALLKWGIGLSLISPIPHSPLPNYLKTVVANYALDKLKIEIAGNSDPAYPHLSSGIDWAISSANFLPSRQFM
jgi:hypothetical protein